MPLLSKNFYLLFSMVSFVSSATSTPIEVSDSCLAGQPCSLDQQILSDFNSTVGGKVFKERPVEAVCFLRDPLYNYNSCNEYRENKEKDEWITQHPSSLTFTNWETCGYQDSCIHTNFATGTCGQGSVPPMAVHVESSSDVISAVKFAKTHDLKVVVKGTGHDYKGRSAGKDGFAIWTHKLQEKKFDQSFVPKGCKVAPQPALTFGAGVVWDTAYEFADQHRKLIVGGDAGFIGVAGGWLQGGGHSFVTPSYGMGVDNLLEMDIVTADGKLQTISECSNPDLFFAVRGGGGGTFGVTTRVSFKAHESVPVHTVLILASRYYNSSLTSNPAEDILERLAEEAPRFSDIGGGGLLFVNLPILKNGVVILGVLPGKSGKSMDDLKAAFEPVLKGLVTPQAPRYTTHASYYDLYKSTIGSSNANSNEPVGIPTIISSRLITRDAFKDPKAVAKALMEAYGKIAPGQSNSNPIQILIIGPSIAGNNSKKTSINPAWYDTVWHAMFTGTWDGNTPESSTRAIFKGVHDASERLRELVPDSGAYQNEADTYQSDHIDDFWGKSNYNRLLSIKRAIDPTNLFSVWQGIGWEGPSHPKFRCYKQNAVAGVDLLN